MANYNFKRKYNENLLNGGALYNSAPYNVNIADNALGDDRINTNVSNLNIIDYSTGADNAILSLISIMALDTIKYNELINLPNISIISNDLGYGTNSFFINDILLNIKDNVNSSNLALVNSDSSILDLGNGFDLAYARRAILYNTGKIYNRNIYDDGANYNSSKDYIVTVSDSEKVNESTFLSFSDIEIMENLFTNENIFIKNMYINFQDSSTSNDDLLLNFNVAIKDLGRCIDLSNISFMPTILNDIGKGTDSIIIPAIPVSIFDLNRSNDSIHLKTLPISVKDNIESNGLVQINSNLLFYDIGKGTDLNYVVGAFFVIDSYGYLQPLGVLVTRDSRYELFPGIKDSIENLPGRHGDIHFDSKFKPRLLELHVATDEGYSQEEKLGLQRLFAKYLDPTKGAKPLIFSDDIEKTYMVKYSGKIDVVNHPSWFEFVLPFKMSNPFIIDSFKRTLTGSGVAINHGNKETPLIIKIAGPVSNPTIKIGSSTISYLGNISSGKEVIIDTGAATAFLNENVNVLDKIEGDLPYYLPPGENSVISNPNITLIWESRWI